jgi:hypothetical protein
MDEHSHQPSKLTIAAKEKRYLKHAMMSTPPLSSNTPARSHQDLLCVCI